MQANKTFSIAIQMCIYMAFKGKDRYSSNELAESVKTNPVVIRRQLAALKKAGLVHSQSGPSGGFFLKKSPEEITLWDLYLATREGAFFKRPKPNPNCEVSSNMKYLVEEHFGEAETSMKPSFEKTTIANLSQDLQKLVNC